MSRGPHSSPQYTKFPKRRKSRNKLEKLIQTNEELIKKYKNEK